MESLISQLSKKAGFLEGEFWGGPRSTGLSATAIDRLGRSRLSTNFILRDFLFCASSAARGLSNFPEDPQAVIRAGRALCEKLLEPILAEFGRFAITYGYQSRESIEQDLAGSAKAFSRLSSCPHQWDRGTFGDAVYARVDILPFCVEDGHVSKRDFGRWVVTVHPPGVSKQRTQNHSAEGKLSACAKAIALKLQPVGLICPKH